MNTDRDKSIDIAIENFVNNIKTGYKQIDDAIERWYIVNERNKINYGEQYQPIIPPIDIYNQKSHQAEVWLCPWYATSFSNVLMSVYDGIIKHSKEAGYINNRIIIDDNTVWYVSERFVNNPIMLRIYKYSLYDFAKYLSMYIRYNAVFPNWRCPGVEKISEKYAPYNGNDDLFESIAGKRGNNAGYNYLFEESKLTFDDLLYLCNCKENYQSEQQI
jgi:hypothetical protein